MDREDCPFHCTLTDVGVKDRMEMTKRKRSSRARDVEEPAA